MEDRLLQQLKKGVLEMLVLEIICEKRTYGYELMAELKTRSNGLFSLKEGTLYPILYRLEDDGMIESAWSQGEGKIAPKKMYAATEKGRQERLRRFQVWKTFSNTVNSFFRED
ncbi:MAG: helix-turn-helix transcriptional regulator [Oscillospiraceae bacterium]|nr:helix-turn-helix transcriptional regulator [Oscillospiraceae bacterium]